MPPAVIQRVTATIAVLLMLALPVGAESDTFKHSPNAERAIALHQKSLDGLLADFYRVVDASDKRFESSAKRYLERFKTTLDREVRVLTRDGEIETATAANKLAKEVARMQITPPDKEGLHFLSSTNLEVPGSEKLTKLGVDLQVDIESAGVQHAQQIQIGIEQYKAKVKNAREVYIEALEKILAQEQRGGRLEAVNEVQRAIDAQKNLDDVATPRTRSGAGAVGQQAVKNKPSYIGYYIIGYTDGLLNKQKLLIQLTADDGMVHSRSVSENNWETLNQPITFIDQQEDVLTFTHKIEGNGDALIHELWLGNGEPIQDRVWASQEDYEAKRNTAKGTVRAAGSPGADLLGLEDGEYILNVDIRKRSTDTFTTKYKIRFKVEHGLVFRTQSAKDKNLNEWRDLGLQFFNVEARKNKLYLTFDKNMYSTWKDVYVFDMSKNDNRTMVGWWDEQSFKEGLIPTHIGELVRVKDE